MSTGGELDKLDELTADRLLDGDYSAADAPDGYSRVARLVGIVKEGIGPQQLDWEPLVVVKMAASIRSARRHSDQAPARKRRRGYISPKIAAAAAMLVVMSGGTAAAADWLPEPIQAAVHNAASAIGVPVPLPDRDGPGTTEARYTVPRGSGASGSLPASNSGPSSLKARPSGTRTSSATSMAVTPPPSNAGQGAATSPSNPVTAPHQSSGKSRSPSSTGSTATTATTVQGRGHSTSTSVPQGHDQPVR